MTTTTGDPASPWAGMTSRPVAGDPASIDPVPSGQAHQLPIVFHGSGSEYFRIWVVNLLLTLVTVGLYYPWAKVRRLRYFYGNTFVGDHALDFHGNPKLMLRGFLIAVVMAIAYSVAGKISTGAALGAFVVVAAVWPALFWTSQRFRLANTSWRSLRFRFSGDLAGAYRAVLPFFVPGFVVVASAALGDLDDRSRALPGLVGLAAVLALPFALWRLKRYQHGHFNLGQVRTELHAGAGSFYGLALKLVGVSLSFPFLLGFAVAILLAGGPRLAGAGFVALIALGMFSYGAAFLIGQPYLASRSQNLVWGRTGSPELRFESALRFWPLFRLTFKNWMLILLTLGFYAPFARVAIARMRLQALSLRSSLDPDQLAASVHDAASPGATGDAAGDLLGFDIGW